jgi:hypothetical protein
MDVLIKNSCFVLLFVVFGFSDLKAQQVDVAFGGIATGTGDSSSYTVGQVFYSSAMRSTNKVNGVVQQPFEITVLSLGVDIYPSMLLNVRLYPNPTTAHITLQFPDFSSERHSLQVLDLNGRAILFFKISSKETTLSVENLMAATYFLNVVDQNKIIKTFKILIMTI